jgi:hypothetical protein
MASKPPKKTARNKGPVKPAGGFAQNQLCVMLIT